MPLHASTKTDGVGSSETQLLYAVSFPAFMVMPLSKIAKVAKPSSKAGSTKAVKLILYKVRLKHAEQWHNNQSIITNLSLSLIFQTI